MFVLIKRLINIYQSINQSLGDEASRGIDTCGAFTSQFRLATRSLGASTLVEHSPHSFPWRRGPSGHRHLWNIHLTVSLGDEASRGIDTCGTFTSQFRLATRPLGASTLVEHSPHSFLWRRGPSWHRHLWNIHLTVSVRDEAPRGIDTCGTFTSQFPLATRPLGESTLVEHSPHSFAWRRGPSGHRHLWNIHLTVSFGDEAPRGIDTCGTFTSQFPLATRPVGVIDTCGTITSQFPLATRPLVASTLVEHRPHSFPWRRGPSRHRHLWNIHRTVSLGDEAPRGIDSCGTFTSQFPLATRPLGESTLVEHSPHSFAWRRGPSGHRPLWNIHLTVSLGDEASRGIDTCGRFTSQFRLATRPLGASTLVEHSPHSFLWRRGPSGKRHLWKIHLTVSLAE